MTDYKGNVLDAICAILGLLWKRPTATGGAKHGNRSMADRPYIRTQESTEIIMKDPMTEKLKPKKHFHKALEGVGGLENITDPGQAPRVRRQISNFRGQHLDQHHLVQEIQQWVWWTCLHTGPRWRQYFFLHEMTTNPGISFCFMATREQLLNMERCCTDTTHFSIVGVDPTKDTSTPV